MVIKFKKTKIVNYGVMSAALGPDFPELHHLPRILRFRIRKIPIMSLYVFHKFCITSS